MAYNSGAVVRAAPPVSRRPRSLRLLCATPISPLSFLTRLPKLPAGRCLSNATLLDGIQIAGATVKKVTRIRLAERSIRCALLASIFAIGAAGIDANSAFADEGGVSFWLPGTFGSLAAAPMQPGWSFASIYYHTTVSAGGDVAAARQVTIGRLNPNLNVNLNASF